MKGKSVVGGGLDEGHSRLEVSREIGGRVCVSFGAAHAGKDVLEVLLDNLLACMVDGNGGLSGVDGLW